MRVFNLAEELEKERKKNKELEEENKKINNLIYKDYIVKDLENKNKWLKNDNEVYKSRIDKALRFIQSECILSDKWEDLGFCNFVPTGRIKYKQLSKAKVEELLNILKGSDNNE
ncbi:MAG: hypothetical protein IKR57_01755 [Bacilli bacterium]|nr:hypothetical protein [Bacilli bacterium]